MEKVDFKIKDETVVPYPSDELEELKLISSYDGVLTMIKEQGIATPPTVRSIVKNGTGQFKKVMGLREFIKKYKEAVS